MFDDGSFIRPSQRSNRIAYALMTNVQTPSSNSHTMKSTHVPVINDTNTGEFFKCEVTLHHTKRLPLPFPVSPQTTASNADILAIDLTTKVWRPKVLNKYVPVDYSDDIDEGVFDYSRYSKTVFRPKLKRADRPRHNLITFETTKYLAELDKGLKICKLVPLSNMRAIRNLVIKYWDCLCAEGANRTILD